MDVRVILNPKTDKLFLVVEPRTDDDRSLLTLFAKQCSEAGSKVWANSSYLLSRDPKLIGILFDTVEKDD